MKKASAKEEAGHGRFNLRRSAAIHPVSSSHCRTSRGPRFVITNRPICNVPTIEWGRIWYTPKRVKGARDNFVRAMVSRKNKRVGGRAVRVMEERGT